MDFCVGISTIVVYNISILISKHKKPHVNYNMKRKCVNGNYVEICKKATPFKGKELKLKAHKKIIERTKI